MSPICRARRTPAAIAGPTAGGALASIALRLTKAPKPPNLRASAGGPGGRMPRNIFFIFLAFGLVFTGGPAFYYVSSWLRVMEGRGWPTTQAVIQSVAVEDRTSRDSDGRTSYTYYPRIAYSYRVGDRMLRGERIRLTGNAFYNDRDDAVAFVQDYQVGRSVPVVYDPRHPGQSALLVESPPWQILLFVGFGLLWIALSVSFRMSGRGPPKQRLGTCRACGARLPFADHGSIRGQVPANFAAMLPGADGRPCPRCGERDPLNSMRNKPGLIIFIIMFVGIWAVGLYLMFFA
jgi:hypothetical protein